MRLSVKTRVLARFFVFASLVFFPASDQAQPSLQVLHSHVRPEVSNGQAALVGPLPQTQRLHLSIVLPLRNQDELTRTLGQLYDPSSPRFRKFLSVTEFTEQFGPTAEDYQAVIDFAKANGFTVTNTPANRLLVSINGTVDQVQQAFHVKMNNYQHPTEDRTFFSPDREPSLTLSVPVMHIAGLNNYSIPRPAAGGWGSGTGPSGQHLPGDWRAAYYTTTAGETGLTGSGQTVGIFAAGGYNICDVTSSFGPAIGSYVPATSTSCVNGVSTIANSYLLSYTPAADGPTYNIPINNVLLDDYTDGPWAGDDVEQVLDIVEAIGMAPGLSQVRNYIGFIFEDVLNAMAAENIAKQLSTSNFYSPDFIPTADPIFEEFAAQGQSFFAASGDFGAYPSVGTYPAEDTWVTAVGGSILLTCNPGGAWCSETTWPYSGGGPSPDGIAIPSWQSGLNGVNGASTTLRNVPDVSMDADGDNYLCVESLPPSICGGGWGGTSGAAPRWAGFMALVNQQAMTADGTTVGFLNPYIYAIGEGSSYNGYNFNSSSYDNDFNDITIGNDDTYGQFSQSIIYNAGPGYDLVTGWGSPNGQNLINDLAPLAGPPASNFTLTASPNYLTIYTGSFGTSTITVNGWGGFTGSVNLSVSGLPNGVSTQGCTGPIITNCKLTLNASGIVNPRTSWLTITGTSGTLTATIYINLTVNSLGTTATPTFTPGGATYTSSQSITISSTTPNAIIYYTTDGTTPTTSSTVYYAAITVSSTETLKAIATAKNYNNSASQSATYTINLPPPSFAIAGTSVTVVPGATTANTSTTTITPSGGFTRSVALTATITSSPAGAQYPPTLSFGSTTPVNISGSNSGTAILTVSTTAASIASLANPMHHGFPWYTEGGAALACILLFGIPARRSRCRTMFGMLALLITLTGGVLACGGGVSGGSSNPGTTAGAYTITVTGTSGTTTATNTVTLNVQ